MTTSSSALINVTSGEPKTLPGPAPFTLEDVLAAIGTHFKQVVIMLIAAGLYAHFSMQTMMVTFASLGIRDEWSWLKDQGLVFNTVLAASAFARLVSSLFFLPWIDIIGRLPFMTISVVLSTLFSLIGCFAPNFTVFTILRFFASFFATALPAATIVYSLEMVRTKDRAFAATLTQVISTISVVYCILLHAVLPNNWRIAMLITHAPTFLFIILLFAIWLETPRFLAATNKDTAKAWKTLAALTPGGQDELLRRLDISAFPPQFKGLEEDHVHDCREDNALIEHSTSEVHSASTVLSASALLPAPAAVSGDRAPPRLSKRKRWVQMVASLMKALKAFVLLKKYRKTTLGLALVWSCQSFAHWGMSSYITTFYAKIQVHALWAPVGTWAIMLPGQGLMYFSMQYLGRLQSIRVFAILGSVTLLLLGVALAAKDHSGWSWMGSTGFLTTICFACYFFGGPIWGVLYGYSAECYPTLYRGTAMTLFATITALSMLVTTYIGVITVDDKRPWLFPIVWAGVRFGVFLGAIIPEKETVHQDLADTMRL